MHQNTFQAQLKPYENIGEDRDRNLIDNLVDEKTPLADPKKESAIKKSQQCKSQFVLETNKSLHSGQRDVRSNLSEKSDLGISQNSNDSSKNSGDQVDMSINSLSPNNRRGDSILFNQGQIIENKTLLAVLGRNERDFIPEAMPILRKITMQNQKEPDLYTNIRRRNTIRMVNQAEEDYKELCDHDTNIEGWKCNTCSANISKFGLFFDDNDGKCSTFTKIVYENSFLEDFQIDFNSQYQQLIQAANEKKPQSSSIIYTAYQPTNIQELREYMFYLMTQRIKKLKKEGVESPLGSGAFKNLSTKLCKYLMTNDDKMNRMKNQTGTLWFDSIFESGNLLQAQKSLTKKDTYNLFMQVDTNTRGHQQWFYFRVKGGQKNTTYTFNIMNFTKPGVTGGKGYKSNEYEMRIHFKSKQRAKATNSDAWQFLTHENCQCEYQKTNVTRRKKDVIAAGADSDQEEWIEEVFQQQTQGVSMMQQRDINLAIPDSNPLIRQETQKDGSKPAKKRKVFYYYALQFKYQFEFDDDTVYFAFAKPVTYSEILEDIHAKERLLMPKQQQQMEPKMDQGNQSNVATQSNATAVRGGKEDQLKINPSELIENNMFQKNIIIDNPNRLLYYQRTELCRSMTGIPLYKIVISRDQRCQKKNQIVLITARVHSGETPGSEVFKGVFDFITSDCREAKYLRRFYTFVLIPCMNPDGVQCGNYRNSVAGVDLNRQWINPEPLFHPEVYHTKSIMQNITNDEKRQIWIFCDIHGHSKKKNSFFYGCNTAANGGFLSWTIVRLLPRILAQKTHMFNYKDSRFRVEPYKIGTARVVAWKQFQITHSFTLENSFYGYEIGEDEHKCFTSEDYKDIGLKFTMAIYDLHFIWKDIQRELRITHGWLKPRTLNELTGVPLAQKVAEETAAAKEEIRKKKAVEQYEEYLKRFYKWKSPFQRISFHHQYNRGVGERISLNDSNSPQKLDKTRNSGGQNKLFSEDITRRHQHDTNQKMLQRTIDGQMNEDLKEAMVDNQSQDEQEFIYKLHRGLTKIQALVRGYQARKKIQSVFDTQKCNILKQIQSHKDIQSSVSKLVTTKQLNFETGSDFGNSKTPIIDNNSSGGEFEFKRSNTDQLCMPRENLSASESGVSSHDTGQSLSIFGGKGFYRPRIDWRQFFDNEELDKAYRIIEVEQRDETDHNSSCMSLGSNSNPSEDNLEEEKIYQDLYRIKNVGEIIKTRKQKFDQFAENIKSDDIGNSENIDGFKPKPRESLSESKGILKDKEINQRIKNKSAANKNKAERIQPVIQKIMVPAKNNEVNKQYLGHFSENKESHKMVIPTQSLKNLANIKSNSPATKKEPSQDMFTSQNYSNRRQIKSNNQQRALTQNLNYQSNQLPSNPVRMIQQSYIKQQIHQRKENINQVIKDCFITKKMNTNLMPTNTKITTQNQQWTPYSNQHILVNINQPKQSHTSQNQRKKSNKQQQPSNSKQTAMGLIGHTPKKGGLVKPSTAQLHESVSMNLQKNSAQKSMDNMIQIGEAAYQQRALQNYMAQTQNPLVVSNFMQFQKQTERDIVSAKTRIRNMNVGQGLVPSNQSTELYNQMNHAYNSSTDKIIPIGLTVKQPGLPSHSMILSSGQMLAPIFSQEDEQIGYIFNSGTKDSASKVQNQNNFRGINSISVLQKEPNAQTNVPNEYIQSQNPVSKQLIKKGLTTTNILSAEEQKSSNIKVNQKGKSQQQPQPQQQIVVQYPQGTQTFIVTSGLITDHSEGLNNLFVSGENRQNSSTKNPGHSLFMKYVQKKASGNKAYEDGNQQNYVVLSIPEDEFVQQKGPKSAMGTTHVVDEEKRKKTFQLVKKDGKTAPENFMILQPFEPHTEKKQRRQNLLKTEDRNNLTDTKQNAAVEYTPVNNLKHLNNTHHRQLVPTSAMNQNRSPSARMSTQMHIHQKEASHGSEAALGTQELMNEIKSLKDHQQKQLNIFYKDLQQSLNQQIQLQFKNNYVQEPVQQFVNINQYNMINRDPVHQEVVTVNEASMFGPSSHSLRDKFSAKEKKLAKSGAQTRVSGQVIQNGVPLTQPSLDQLQQKHRQQSSKKIMTMESNKLEAHDKIPVGLQSLMGGNISIVPKQKNSNQQSSTVKSRGQINSAIRTSQNTMAGLDQLKTGDNKMKYSEAYLIKHK